MKTTPQTGRFGKMRRFPFSVCRRNPWLTGMLAAVLLGGGRFVENVQAQNLLSNGNFELGTFDGWITNGGSMLIATNNPGGWTPGAGAYSAAVINPNQVFQRFGTVSGQTYNVSLIYQGSPIMYIRTATNNDAFSSGAILLGAGQLPASGAGASTSPYLGLYTNTFTALSSLSKIAFYDSSGGWQAFDNVSIVIPIPEPGFLALMAVGGMGFCFVARRKSVCRGG